MKWYEKIIAVHLAVTDQVSHAEHMKSDRYFVWQEDGANDLEADGLHVERAITGSTDLFTKQEFDPWKEPPWKRQVCRGPTIPFSMRRKPDTIIMNGTGR